MKAHCRLSRPALSDEGKETGTPSGPQASASPELQCQRPGSSLRRNDGKGRPKAGELPGRTSYYLMSRPTGRHFG